MSPCAGHHKLGRHGKVLHAHSSPFSDGLTAGDCRIRKRVGSRRIHGVIYQQAKPVNSSKVPYSIWDLLWDSAEIVQHSDYC